MATIMQYGFIFVLIFFILSNMAISERCHPNDKKALLKIVTDLSSPNHMIYGDPNTDCCDWNFVVTCDDVTDRVTILVLQKADFNRPIPAAVFDLVFLEELILHKANFTGRIPQAITNLSRLKILDLSWNRLSGNIPSFLSQLSKLKLIELSFNNFTGSIPASLSQLQNLTGLFLGRNKLTGQIPESFADFRQQNFYLQMSHNQLSGEIPKKMGLANFTDIDVSRNRLEGDISFMFGKNASLIYADFSRNLLRFDFSKVEYFSKSLRGLDLNHNMITGSLPVVLVDSSLDRLNVSYNRMCGRIPVGGRLQEFETTSYFHNRCLCGAPLHECK
ncbi:hypothetical protein ACP275_10G178600 [Erythranthe tilingii]